MKKEMFFIKIIVLFIFIAAPVCAAAQTIRYITYFPTPHASYTQFRTSIALLATRGRILSPEFVRAGIVEAGSPTAAGYSPGQGGVKLRATSADAVPGNDPYIPYSAAGFYNLTVQTRSGSGNTTMNNLHVGYPDATYSSVPAPNVPHGVFGTMGNMTVSFASTSPFGPQVPAVPTATTIGTTISGLRDFSLLADGVLRIDSLAWGVGPQPTTSTPNTYFMGGIGRTWNAAESGWGSGWGTGTNRCNVTATNYCCVLSWKQMRLKDTGAYRTYFICNEGCSGC